VKWKFNFFTQRLRKCPIPIRFAHFLFGAMGHFHNLLCEEMIFPLLKEKNDGLRYMNM
jgi:hypothetical protein